MQDFAADYLNPIFRLLNYDLFVLGEARITPLSIVYLLVLSVGLVYLSRKIKNLLVTRLLQRTRMDVGAQQAIGTIVRYIVLFVGFLIILQTVGINLTTVNVLAGAVGIGIGLGLQNIANNFISGLIILFERPIKVGDRISVEGVHGDVTSIGARSTTIRTNDNIAIIVPNSKFISETVTNWSFTGNNARFRIPVGVSYDADVDLVRRLLIETAGENEDVLAEPEPDVRLVAFGDNSMNFELSVWSASKLHRPGRLKSSLNFAIVRKFREHGIEIPFPQREVRVRTDTKSSQADGLNAHSGQASA